jgi:hypothetical protein
LDLADEKSANDALFPSQLLMTGNMLFEILDPFLMWKQIYLSLRKTISETGTGGVSGLWFAQG